MASAAPIARVALAVKENEGLNPMDVGFFGTDGIVLEADGISYTFDKLSASLVEQFGFGHELPALLTLERSLPMRYLVLSQGGLYLKFERNPNCGLEFESE